MSNDLPRVFCLVLRASRRPEIPFVPKTDPYEGSAGTVYFGNTSPENLYVPARGRNFLVHPVKHSLDETFYKSLAEGVSEAYSNPESQPLRSRLGDNLCDSMPEFSAFFLEQVAPFSVVTIGCRSTLLYFIGVTCDDYDLLVVSQACPESVLSSYAWNSHLLVPMFESSEIVTTLHPKRIASRWYRLTQSGKDRLLKFAALKAHITGA